MWVPEGAAIDGTQLKAVPPATLEDEIGHRQAFLDSISLDETSRNAMLQTLTTTSALWAFSQAVRTRGLSKKWHAFRFERILSRIRSWCKAVGVPWREAWLAESGSTDWAAALPMKSEPQQRENLTQILGRLSDADLQRISVPLDLVLKMMRE